MTIEFSSNVPVPTTVRAPRISKYPFGELLVDESFHVSGDTLPKKPVESIRAAVYSFNKTRRNAGKEPFKLVVRADGDGVRVWRTA